MEPDARRCGAESEKAPGTACPELLHSAFLPVGREPYEQPLVAPQVSHFSQVPLRTMVKFWHSVHMLPV